MGPDSLPLGPPWGPLLALWLAPCLLPAGVVAAPLLLGPPGALLGPSGGIGFTLIWAFWGPWGPAGGLPLPCPFALDLGPSWGPCWAAAGAPASIPSTDKTWGLAITGTASKAATNSSSRTLNLRAHAHPFSHSSVPTTSSTSTIVLRFRCLPKHSLCDVLQEKRLCLDRRLSKQSQGELQVFPFRA